MKQERDGFYYDFPLMTVINEPLEQYVWNSGRTLITYSSLYAAYLYVNNYKHGNDEKIGDFIWQI